MTYENELKHYGVKGMKWGVRKSRKELTKSDIRNRYDSAKAARKQADKAYGKSFNKAYNYTDFHPIASNFTKKGREKSNQLWNKAYDDAEQYRKANKQYKAVKKERKTRIKDTYKSIQKDSSFGEKLMYNNATRKAAAKYVVDNNMSVSEAKQRANQDAIRNSAAILAAYGAVAVGAMAYDKLKK